MSSSDGWTWDATTGQYVRWSQANGCWVNSRGERVRGQQSSESTAASSRRSPSTTSTTTPSSSGGAQPRTSSSNVARATDTMPSIESSMAQMYVSSGGNPSRTTATASSSGTNTASTRGTAPQAYAATHTDPATGIQTRWEVSGSSQYTDPVDASSRSLNVKRIRMTGSSRDIRSSSSTQSDYRSGRVIEVLLVPPPLTSTDAVSRITPNDDAPDRGLIRLRRFVIIRDDIDGGNSFEAIAIKTYNSQGVGAPGVIKSHHAVIYTGHHPQIGAAEGPQRMANGLLENGMLPQSIKVVAYDRAKALDPMARLDFGDRYQFDNGVSNMRVWGRVHEDSQAALYVQFNSVWRDIRNAASGPGAMGVMTAPNIQPPTTATSSVTTTRPTNQRRSDRTGGQRRAAPRSNTNNLPPVGTTPITDDQMLALLRAYRAHALRERLHWPEEALSSQQIHALALNPQPRITYMRRITDSWEEDSSDSE